MGTAAHVLIAAALGFCIFVNTLTVGLRVGRVLGPQAGVFAAAVHALLTLYPNPHANFAGLVLLIAVLVFFGGPGSRLFKRAKVLVSSALTAVQQATLTREVAEARMSRSES